MKRTSTYKHWNTCHAKKQQRRALKYKDYRKKRNREKQGVSYEERKIRGQIERDKWKFDRIKAPNDFSFLEHPVETVKFIERLKINFERRRPTFVMLKHIENVDHDALLVLLSTMVTFKAKKIDFNGDFPLKEEPFKIMSESGFHENLYKTQFKQENKYILRKGDNFITNANKAVDAPLGDHLIGAAAEVVWGEKRRCKGAQRSLIELMQNTKDHAALDMTLGKHWWLSVKHYQEEKKVAFSFVDYGIGIFESLKQKPTDNKFFGGLDRMFTKFKYGGNHELLRLIMKGDLHETVTGKKYRGKGLPGIKEAYDMGFISNLVVITNDVYANVAENKYDKMKSKFNGTFVRFELQPQNLNEVWSI